MSMSRQPARSPSAEGALAILEAAESLFAEKGFDGASINDIAHRAGVSKANIFHHFTSKKGLYLAVLKRAVAHSAGILAKGPPPADPAQSDRRLKQFFSEHLDALLEQPETTRLILREVLENGSESGQSLAEGIFADYFTRLVGWVRMGQEAGWLRGGFDPALLAFTLIAVNVHFFQALPILQHLPGAGFAFDSKTFSEQIFGLLMDGAGASSNVWEEEA